MSFRSVSTAIMLTVMMFVVPFANVASADVTTQAPSSYAYLPSWAGAITGDLDQIGENTSGIRLANMILMKRTTCILFQVKITAVG